MRGENEPPSRNGAGSFEALGPELHLSAWRDPVVEAVGHGARSPYVETFWLPVLGPTATWLYRRLGTWAESEPDGASIDPIDLSVSLGLGHGSGRRSSLGRATERLVRYHVARWRHGGLQVRTRLAPLSERQVERLSDELQELHRAFVHSHQSQSTVVNETANPLLHVAATNGKLLHHPYMKGGE